MLLVTSAVSINLVVDPFGVFDTSSLPDGPSSNERYRKIEHLQAHPGQYTHLIFGSSRSGMTPPAWVDELTGDTTYNLSVFSASPTDMQLLYRGFRDIDGPPRAVTIGLDAMAFLSEPDDSDLSRRHHPSALPTPAVSYWLDYLLAPSIVPTLDKLAARSEPDISFDWSHGTYALDGKDREIAADHEGYIRITFENWVPRQFDDTMDREEWSVLEIWLAELENDGVEVTLFLQPMHHQWRQRMEPLLASLSPLLEQLPNLIDLSAAGANDNRLWYEQRHYRPVLARQLMSQLYGRHAEVAAIVAAPVRTSAESQ